MAEPQAPQSESPLPVQDLTGTTVGRFAIRVRLGAGGMGEVYRAEDTKLKRPVALKRMAPRLQSDERYRRRFLKEAERASALTDEHIAGLYDVFEERGEIFLVMEYVEGVTLRRRLEQPLSLKEFLALAVQCATALVTAHGKSIIHRDLKPENIMLTPAGQVKILDFGVAKRLPRAEETATTETLDPTAGGLSGTPAYMAPEVLLEQEPDGRADIFSLGVVFYEALTGRHPFRTRSFLATTDRILHAAPAPLREANPRVLAELERIVAKMLAKEPDERYATAADLLVDLRALERGERPQPRPSPLPRQLWYRRRWIQLAGAMVALAIAVVLGWRLWPPVAPPERVPVAILPFANRTGDLRLDQYRFTLTQMLVLDLTESPNIKVLPYERLVEITQGIQAEGKDISSAEAVQAVAGYSNVQYVVVPAMYAVGNSLRVSAEFRDARTGEVVGAIKAERVLSGPAEDTLYSMEAELVDGIQRYFKGVGRGEDYRPRPATSRPQTVAAALHLTEGRNAFAQGDYAQALGSFQRVVDADPGFALAYAWMGQIYGILGYDEKARALSEKAVQLITPQTPLTDAYFIEANFAERKYDFSAAEAKYLELIRLYPDEPGWQAQLAEVYEKQGEYAKAVASYQEVLRRDPKYIVAYQELAVLYTRMNNLEQAVSQGEQALSLYRAIGSREGEASALVVLGEAFRGKRDYQQARDCGQSALEIFKGLQNEFGVVWATKLLGDIRFSEGDYPGARRYYEQVLSASGELGNNRLVARTLMNVGVTYSRQGDQAKAVEYYERSLAQGRLYGEYKDWPALRDRAMALSNLGGILIEYGPDPERGVQLVRESLPIFEMMRNNWWVAKAHAALGLHFINRGRYPEAIAALQQAQALYRAIPDQERVAYVTYLLGRGYFHQNQYEQALGSFNEALTAAQMAQEGFRAADIQIHLGRTHLRLGAPAQAGALIEQSLRAAQQKGYGEVLPDAYDALGEMYAEMGYQEGARLSFQQASALWKEPYVSEFSIEARSELGVLEAESGNLELGFTHCQQAVAAARKLMRQHTLARTLLNLARVYLLRQEYQKVIDTLGEITSLGEKELGPELRAQAFYLRGQALEGLGKTEEAKASYRQAQEIIRRLQQTLAAGHRESFAKRRDIQVLLPSS